MECENCLNETVTGSCVECGCNLCEQCKQKNVVEGKPYCDLCNEKYFEDIL